MTNNQTDWRALCAELHAALEKHDVTWEEENLLDQSAAALRRPKPPSLKEQSLKHLEVMERDGHYLPEIMQDLRRALEQLPE